MPIAYKFAYKYVLLFKRKKALSDILAWSSCILQNSKHGEGCLKLKAQICKVLFET